MVSAFPIQQHYEKKKGKKERNGRWDLHVVTPYYVQAQH
jgi:hypothetical protein